ncbi:MAG: hypothetical protein N2515_00990 [Deltaproteobacteria bacterium]|nr:hypothetical protein [Deltaproteobacteria bacterium]
MPLRSPNWFVALPASGWGISERLPPLPRGFRPMADEDLHVTIAFFGPIEAEGAERAFRDFVASGPYPALSAFLGPVVPMGGDASRYTALSALLWASSQGFLEQTERWHRELRAQAGLLPENRPFRPHLTLARPSPRANPKERAAGLSWAKSIDFGGMGLRFERIALYTWSEDRSKRLFRIVSEAKLVDG